MRLRVLTAVGALFAALVAAGTANASQLVDRNAKGVRLEVNASG